MHQLAESLTRYAGKPVIDATNLEGYFTIALTFASEETDVTGTGGGTGALSQKRHIQEQPGLKLTPVQRRKSKSSSWTTLTAHQPKTE